MSFAKESPESEFILSSTMIDWKCVFNINGLVLYFSFTTHCWKYHVNLRISSNLRKSLVYRFFIMGWQLRGISGVIALWLSYLLFELMTFINQWPERDPENGDFQLAACVGVDPKAMSGWPLPTQAASALTSQLGCCHSVPGGRVCCFSRKLTSCPPERFRLQLLGWRLKGVDTMALRPRPMLAAQGSSIRGAGGSKQPLESKPWLIPGRRPELDGQRLSQI